MTTPRVEKAPAKGQRISRQPWKAWNRHGRYLGVFATKREAQVAANTDTRLAPAPEHPTDGIVRQRLVPGCGGEAAW